MSKKKGAASTEPPQAKTTCANLMGTTPHKRPGIDWEAAVHELEAGTSSAVSNLLGISPEDRLRNRRDCLNGAIRKYERELGRPPSQRELSEEFCAEMLAEARAELAALVAGEVQ
jgi:hypothetical protein